MELRTYSPPLTTDRLISYAVVVNVVNRNGLDPGKQVECLVRAVNAAGFRTRSILFTTFTTAT
jgi:hypothetical protein